MRNVEEVLLNTGKVSMMAIDAAKDNINPNYSSDDLWRYFVYTTKVVTEKEVFQSFAQLSRLEFVDLKNFDISAEALSKLSPSFCRRENMIPLDIRDHIFFIGTTQPDNYAAIDEISASTFDTVSLKIVEPSELVATLDRVYRSDEEIEKLSEEIEQNINDDDDNGEDLEDEEDTSPIVRFVNLLIAQAVQDRASDIHVEPGEKELTVRYRIDGVLHILQKADRNIQNGVISRLKVMSDIDIGERRKPQDGRMSIKHAGKTIDIRVVTLPTTWGEKVVMRILDHSNERQSIESIGMSEHNEKIFSNAISKPHGMILVTGPTGSGKALPLTTKIATPTGFTTMNDIQENDEILGGNGKIHHVTSVSTIDEHSLIYEITFTDGQKILADGDHQWLISTKKSRTLHKDNKKEQAIKDYIDSHKTLTKIAYLSMEFNEDCGNRTAEELLSLLHKENIYYFTKSEDIEQALHMMDSVNYTGVRENEENVVEEITEYPVEDALMNLAMRIRQQHAVVQSSETPVIRMTTEEMMNNGLYDNSEYNYAIPMPQPLELPEKVLKYDFYDMGLLWGTSRKPIDIEYLRGSYQQRIKLLRGLCDVSHIEHNNDFMTLYTVDSLSDDILQLIRSLGVKASLSVEEDTVIISFPSYVFDNDSEKLCDDSRWNFIADISVIGEMPARCISVDSPDFTYLVGEGFIVTSNSTTIYTALAEVSKPTVNVVTVEDPVEKKIPGINQLQINNKAGMTFSNALRAILRADPDVVFVGEIRDEETAKIAIDASMTGHLVLSTLHTNGAPEAASRLIEMGVEPYLVGNSVTCVVAQRLARRLCVDCKEPIEISEETLDEIEFPFKNVQLYGPNGCHNCANTGYRGRIALTEVMSINEPLEQLIAQQKTATEIRREAENYGLVSLKKDGFEKVAHGLTTIDEILRIAV